MKVFIDPGHNYSGADTGAVGSGLREQDITYGIAEKVRPLLEQYGFAVKMSRNALKDNVGGSTVSSSLNARTSMANEWNADIFISIHCNSGGGTGTETYCYQSGTKGYQLAEDVQKQVVAAIGLPDRGVKTDSRLAVLRGSQMPAILLETAFIDTEQDAAVLGSSSGQQRYAEAITHGVCDYAGIEFESEDLTMSQYEELSSKLDQMMNQLSALSGEIQQLKADTTPMIYNYIDDNMPDWARPTIQKLVDQGVLKGDADGKLGLTDEMLRLLVIHDRLGLYDSK